MKIATHRLNLVAVAVLSLSVIGCGGSGARNASDGSAPVAGTPPTLNSGTASAPTIVIRPNRLTLSDGVVTALRVEVDITNNGTGAVAFSGGDASPYLEPIVTTAGPPSTALRIRYHAQTPGELFPPFQILVGLWPAATYTVLEPGETFTSHLELRLPIRPTNHLRTFFIDPPPTSPVPISHPDYVPVEHTTDTPPSVAMAFPLTLEVIVGWGVPEGPDRTDPDLSTPAAYAAWESRVTATKVVKDQ